MRYHDEYEYQPTDLVLGADEYRVFTLGTMPVDSPTAPSECERVLSPFFHSGMRVWRLGSSGQVLVGNLGYDLKV